MNRANFVESGASTTLPILVHDYLLVRRGAERCFLALCDLFPGAPVRTLLFDSEVFGARLSGHEIMASPLQRFRVRQDSFKMLMPLMPAAAERMAVDGHSLVLSSSSAFAHGVRPDPGSLHLCYCHSPFRYGWFEEERDLMAVPAPLRPLVIRSLERISRWDHRAAQRATTYIANGRITQARIRRYWGRGAPIVHPPVDLDRFAADEPEDYFLIVGELVGHKQTELALEAAREARVPVRVVGGGVNEERLRARHGDHAEFLGRVSDAELARLYAGARALVMPNIEEFGIIAVEAQASGRPVIAADGGGAQETVVHGETGLLFAPGDLRGLVSALRDPWLDSFEPRHAIENAGRFSVAAFQQGIVEQIGEAAAAAGQDIELPDVPSPTAVR